MTEPSSQRCSTDRDVADVGRDGRGQLCRRRQWCVLPRPDRSCRICRICSGRVDGTALAMVEAIIENRSTICAIDVPSGLDGASGSVLGSAAQPPRAVVRPADAGTRTVRGGLRVCLAPRCRCLGFWARSNRREPPDRAAGGVASARRSVMVGFASTDQERGSANLARGVGPGPLSAGTRTLVIVGHTG